MHKPVLGILGGVGPLATAYFMRLLVEKTPARSDQEHMPTIVINDPQIPDRTASILSEAAPSPLPEMIEVAQMLERAGADFIAIPCNTAHYFYEGVSRAVEVPVINIMEETASTLASSLRSVRKVGLMATEGTVLSGVFENCFKAHGIDVVVPDKAHQRILNDLIYERVKANLPYDASDLLLVAHELQTQGCEAVIVGCTELSVVFKSIDDKPFYLFDSLDILAKRCVDLYFEARRVGDLTVLREGTERQTNR